jgi:RHS repeat-associated protein
MTMPGRKFSSTGGYRYGFNGQENSNEIAVGLTTAMYWEYDSRIGRRWNLDPKPTSGLSQYTVFFNNPIWFNDPFGDTTYLYNSKGMYKGVLIDGLKTNEIVTMNDKYLNNILKFQRDKTYTDNTLGIIARSPDIADARFTTKTFNELSKNWSGNSNERIGLLYADKNTKEVKISKCKECEESAGSADLPKLNKTVNNISKKGKIIGMWHTHPPANSLAGSQPTPGEDRQNPASNITVLTAGGVGVIVNKSTITIFPIYSGLHNFGNDTKVDDRITVPKFSKDYKGIKPEFQFGVFDQNLSPKTYWNAW